jgi:hypothetical protein
MLYLYYLKNCVYILLFGVILLGCKKKEAEAPIDPNTGCANCAPSYATAFNGILKAGTYTITGAAISTSISTRVSAYFSTTTITIPSVANSTTVNNVFFNEDTLVFSGAPYYYTNTSPVTLNPVSWTVTGTSALPSFTYKNLKEKPSFSSITAWPDTVSKNVGFTFYIYDLNYITGATVFISDGLPVPNVSTKGLGVGSDTLKFTSADLSSLGTSTNAIITLVMENAHAIKVDGKDFKVSNEASYTRRIVIKN